MDVGKEKFMIYQSEIWSLLLLLAVRWKMYEEGKSFHN